MAMDKDLKSLLKQTVTNFAFLSYDDHNDFTWTGTGATFTGRVEYFNKLIRDKDGQEQISTCQIYCDGNVIIDTRDKITATGLVPIYPEILQVERQPDETGNVYYVCIHMK